VAARPRRLAVRGGGGRRQHFALAYYRRALANGFQARGDAGLAERNERELDLAVRHAGRLAPRERDLILAYRELAAGLGTASHTKMGAPERLAAAEARYAELVQREPQSADGWYGLGDARYHLAGQSHDWRTVQRLWNGSLRAFERTIGLDSSFHLAYQHRLDMYTLAAVPGSGLVLDGDSLRLLNAAERTAYGEARFQAAKTRAQQLVVRDARAWVASDSAATKAYEALARAFVAAGQPDSAVRVLEAGLANPEARRPTLAYQMAYARAASGDHPGALAEVRRALARFPADSLRGELSPDGFWGVLGGAGVAAAAGAPGDVHRVIVTAAEALPEMPVPGGARLPTPPLARWFEAGLHLAMGLPTEGPARVVARGIPLLDAVPGEGGRKARILSVGVPYAAYLATGDERFRATAVSWADTSAFTPFTELEALAAVQRGDTARARVPRRRLPAGHRRLRPRRDAAGGARPGVAPPRRRAPRRRDARGHRRAARDGARVRRRGAPDLRAQPPAARAALGAARRPAARRGGVPALPRRVARRRPGARRAAPRGARGAGPAARRAGGAAGAGELARKAGGRRAASGLSAARRRGESGRHPGTRAPDQARRFTRVQRAPRSAALTPLSSRTQAALEPPSTRSSPQGRQSAMNRFVSPAFAAPRFDAHTSRVPSGLNIGKPSNSASNVTCSSSVPSRLTR
jgi:tetratricopeptide (TPR) repeat protein